MSKISIEKICLEAYERAMAIELENERAKSFATAVRELTPPDYYVGNIAWLDFICGISFLQNGIECRVTVDRVTKDVSMVILYHPETRDIIRLLHNSVSANHCSTQERFKKFIIDRLECFFQMQGLAYVVMMTDCEQSNEFIVNVQNYISKTTERFHIKDKTVISL